MSNESELQQHYRLLLGIQLPWQIKSVNLDVNGKRVEIGLEWSAGQKAACPVCGQACGLYDQAGERTWRHLDTMQFQTIIRARVPRIECPTDGVKTIVVPWAEPHGRFSRLFERFAIDVLLCARSLTQAATLLDLSWDEVEHILRRGVKRGLLRRELDGVRYVGIDEKSFGAGQSYISLLTDLEGRRVLEVVADRTQAAAESLWSTLSQPQRTQVEAVALDMWEPFMEAARVQVPQADLVHDKFHVAKHLNEAVDQVRRAENKELLAQGDETLKGTRQLWLYNPQHLSREQTGVFSALREQGLKVARAWAAKELFTRIWTYSYAGAARRFFADWYSWVSRSRLKPLVKVGKMLKRHLENILTYLRHPITNAVTEGLNSKIQMIKSNARGFRNFENYRTRILFFCGKLDLYPR
ncbi:MAG TPA: ISL3 family transposase [Verrucomicrobiae bacterium]|nr:ISL3 family transposase [Verrucomicrobiae bacterium]